MLVIICTIALFIILFFTSSIWPPWSEPSKSVSAINHQMLGKIQGRRLQCWSTNIWSLQRTLGMQHRRTKSRSELVRSELWMDWTLWVGMHFSLGFKQKKNLAQSSAFQKAFLIVYSTLFLNLQKKIIEYSNKFYPKIMRSWCDLRQIYLPSSQQKDGRLVFLREELDMI